MSLKQTIETEYKKALKSKDKTKISTYRLILSSIKDLDIQNRSGPNKKETDDEDIKKLFKKMVKQRAESIEIYKKNNRTDLLEVEQNEYDIISSFLPKVLGDEETKKICDNIITKLGASSLKDMGKVMGELKKEHSDKIDPSTVEAIELSIKALKETLESEDPSADKIRARAQDVTDAAMKLGEAIYKAEAEANQSNDDDVNNETTNENNKDDVVDADFEDLNKTDK